jgi:hypothetical protein
MCQICDIEAATRKHTKSIKILHKKGGDKHAMSADKMLLLSDKFNPTSQ